MEGVFSAKNVPIKNLEHIRAVIREMKLSIAIMRESDTYLLSTSQIINKIQYLANAVGYQRSVPTPNGSTAGQLSYWIPSVTKYLDNLAKSLGNPYEQAAGIIGQSPATSARPADIIIGEDNDNTFVNRLSDSLDVTLVDDVDFTVTEQDKIKTLHMSANNFMKRMFCDSFIPKQAIVQQQKPVLLDDKSYKVIVSGTRDDPFTGWSNDEVPSVTSVEAYSRVSCDSFIVSSIDGTTTLTIAKDTSKSELLISFYVVSQNPDFTFTLSNDSNEDSDHKAKLTANGSGYSGKYSVSVVPGVKEAVISDMSTDSLVYIDMKCSTPFEDNITLTSKTGDMYKYRPGLSYEQLITRDSPVSDSVCCDNTLASHIMSMAGYKEFIMVYSIYYDLYCNDRKDTKELRLSDKSLTTDPVNWPALIIDPDSGNNDIEIAVRADFEIIMGLVQTSQAYVSEYNNYM